MADYTLSAKITGDASSFTRAMDGAKAKMDGLSNNVKDFGSKVSGVGKDVAKFGGKVTAGATLPIIAAGTGMIKAASDAEEMRGKFSVVFDGMERDVRDFAATSANAWGRSQVDVEGYLAETQNLVVGMGMARDAGAEFSKEIVTLGVDLASFNNLAEDDALNNLTSAISGNHNAAKSLGAVLNENTLAIEMERMGLQGKFQDLDEGTKMQVRYNAILSQSADAIGDAERTSDSFANQVRNLRGGIKDLSVEMGDILLPHATALVSKVNELVDWFRGLDDQVKTNIMIFAGLIALIGPIIMAVGFFGIALGGLITMFGILISPIGLVIGGLVALGAAFAVAWFQSEEFRDRVTGAFGTAKDTVMGVVETVRENLSGMFQGGIEGAESLRESLTGKLMTAFETIRSVVSTIADVVVQFVGSIADGFTSAGGSVSQLSNLFMLFNPILKIGLMVLTEFGPQIAAGFQEIMSLALPILLLLGETLGQLAAAVIPLVMNVIATLIPIIITLGTTIMEIVMSVLPILLTLLMQIVPVVMSLVTTVISLISQLLPLVQVIIGALVPVLVLMIDTILNIVQAVAPALIAILGAVIAVFQAIIPVVVAVLSTVIDVMANIIAAIMPIIAFVAGVITSIIAIIAPIVTFIAGVIASIFKVITPIISFVTGTFTTVFTIISGIFQSVLQFITSTISAITSIISSLSGVVSGVFNGIWATVSSIMDMVNNRITGVFTAIKSSWTGLKTFVSDIFSGIGDNMKTLVNQVKGFVNVVIGSINSAIGLINKIPGVSIGRIPMLQRGTDDWEGGFARINEGGRGELVNLPNGAQVIPHDVSMRYAKEAGRSNGDAAAHQRSSDSRSTDINQTNNFYSNRPLTPMEVKKSLNQQSRQMAMQWR